MLNENDKKINHSKRLDINRHFINFALANFIICIMDTDRIQNEETRVIDPILDEGFKLLFGRENVSERLLVSFLKSLFADDPILRNIEHVEFINTEHQSEYRDGRTIRYDIKCKTSTGHKFIVEMQNASQVNILDRSEYYLSRAIAKQGYKGKDRTSRNWNHKLTPVVGVFICNFNVNGLDRKAITHLGVCDMETGKPIGAAKRSVFIQLPSFKKDEDECTQESDKWIYNIKNMGTMQRVAFKTEEDIFNYLDEVSNVAALDEDEREFYEDALKYVRDRNAEREFAMEEGLAKGRAEGRADAIKDTVIRMIDAKCDDDLIKDITGVSQGQLDNIKLSMLK